MLIDVRVSTYVLSVLLVPLVLVCSLRVFTLTPPKNREEFWKYVKDGGRNSQSVYLWSSEIKLKLIDVFELVSLRITL